MEGSWARPEPTPASQGVKRLWEVTSSNTLLSADPQEERGGARRGILGRGHGCKSPGGESWAGGPRGGAGQQAGPSRQEKERYRPTDALRGQRGQGELSLCL